MAHLIRFRSASSPISVRFRPDSGPLFEINRPAWPASWFLSTPGHRFLKRKPCTLEVRIISRHIWKWHILCDFDVWKLKRHNKWLEGLLCRVGYSHFEVIKGIVYRWQPCGSRLCRSTVTFSLFVVGSKSRLCRSTVTFSLFVLGSRLCRSTVTFSLFVVCLSFWVKVMVLGFFPIVHAGDHGAIVPQQVFKKKAMYPWSSNNKPSYLEMTYPVWFRRLKTETSQQVIRRVVVSCRLFTLRSY